MNPTADERRPARFRYEGSYAGGAGYFGSAGWLTESECRKGVAALLRRADVVQDSIQICVQAKAGRWKPLARGTVTELFPEIQHAFECEVAIAALLQQPGTTAEMRYAAKIALARGVAEPLRQTRELLHFLEHLQRVLAAHKAEAARDAFPHQEETNNDATPAHAGMQVQPHPGEAKHVIAQGDQEYGSCLDCQRSARGTSMNCSGKLRA